MKNFFLKLPVTAMAALLMSALMITSCRNDDDDNQPQQNIAQVVNSNADFSLLRAAIQRAGLGNALSGGNLTVFAPNNAAFQAAGLTETAINGMSQQDLAAVLQYHVVDGRQTAASLPSAMNTAVTALSNGTLYITKNNNMVSVNGARVITPDVTASNGVIHVIDKVLMPPSGNIVQLAAGNSQFTYLVAAIQRASQGNTNVAQVLSGAGPYTVFAPVNQAFINAGFPTTESLSAADPALLASILTYHVVSGRVFSTNLTNGNVATVQGGNVSVNTGSGVQITGVGNNGNAANVVAADMMATNGVVHVIDRVLLPSN